MLRLLIASIALGLSWSWLRAELSRAIDSKAAPKKNALLVRGIAFAVTLVWFMLQFGRVLGTMLVWGGVLAVVGVGAWLLVERIKGRAEAAPPEGGAPPSDEEPPGSASA